jgi:hypothetical protein
MPPSTNRITIVRTKVAKSELMFSTRILVKTAVTAANATDRTAQNCHVVTGEFIVHLHR